MNYEAARQSFGNRVRELRQERGTTQEQLAELMGKTTEHISFLERGERSPSFEVIVDLAKSLAVSMSYLMNIEFNIKQPEDHTELIDTLIAAPVSPTLVEPVEEPITTENEQ